MSQLAMFAPAWSPPDDDWFCAPALIARPTGKVPRFYQRDVWGKITSSFEQYRSCLLVMATGCGKTFVFAHYAHNWDGQVLILAHRDELVRQSAATIRDITGEQVGIEKAEERSNGERIVVGSVQSMNQARLDRLGKDRFSLCIVDEAHHYVSPTYRRAAEYFDCKLLGVTATPDRGDEKALGAIFEDVAFVYDIRDAMNDGFLVPIVGQQVHLDEIDISGVDTTAGDLQAGQLDEAMMKSVEGVVTETLRLADKRQGIVFWPGVKTAEHACERMNQLRPGSAGWICGATHEDERRATLQDFRDGRIQFLHNCQVLTEGTDLPMCALIAMARPTKSRQLYAQVMGRGLRVLPGIVDHLPEREQAGERARLIATSSKPDCLVLDFVGNAGRHSLVGPVDVLGGDYSEDEVEEAKKLQKGGDKSEVRQLLEAARAALKAAAAKIKSTVKSRTSRFDPFSILNVDNQESFKYTRRFGFVAATERQRDALAKFGFKADDGVNELSKQEASKLIGEMMTRAQRGLASYGQLKQLQRFGITDRDITKERAMAGMNYLQQKGWGKKGVDPATLLEIIHHQRQPGEDT